MNNQTQSITHIKQAQLSDQLGLSQRTLERLARRRLDPYSSRFCSHVAIYKIQWDYRRLPNSNGNDLSTC